MAAHDDVVAAAGAGVAAVEHEFFGAEAGVVGIFVEACGDGDGFVPGVDGVGVDFDDAGIGRDFE